jgi:hypothetical protein
MVLTTANTKKVTVTLKSNSCISKINTLKHGQVIPGSIGNGLCFHTIYEAFLYPNVG